jgi:hypothetical protein
MGFQFASEPENVLLSCLQVIIILLQKQISDITNKSVHLRSDEKFTQHSVLTSVNSYS